MDYSYFQISAEDLGKDAKVELVKCGDSGEVFYEIAQEMLNMIKEHNAAGKQVVSAEVPMSELFGYNTDLRSMTGGIGTYEDHFDHYEQAPRDIQDKEVAKKAAEEKKAKKDAERQHIEYEIKASEPEDDEE